MARYHQGQFKIKNRQKYIGNADNIKYRSSWELSCMIRFDADPSIKKWSSEEIAIMYISPRDNRPHRYFPDFFIQTDTDKFIVEVKPLKETKLPSSKTTKTRRRLIKETITYSINQQKWAAAEAFCVANNWKFRVITEKDLFGGK